MHSLKGTSILFLFLFLVSGLNAQFNFKVGYTGSYVDPTINNEILQAYNAERPWLDKTFSEPSFLSGIVLGIRQRFEFVALDVSWYGRFRGVRIEGIDPVTMETYERKLNYNLNSYSLGIENFIGPVSIGGSIDVNQTGIRAKKTERDDRFSVINKWNYGSHFFVSYNLKGNQLQLSIRPFVQMHWSDIDLTPLAAELEVSTAGGEYKENFMNFGIMLVFFNGE